MTSWLHEQRLDAVQAAVRRSGARSVIDLGCGDGDLLVRLAERDGIDRIVGVDTCPEALERLRRRLRDAGAGDSAAVELVQGSMVEEAGSRTGFDCALLVESIEHIDPDRLSVLERAVFGEMRPSTVVITTPNAEFNGLLGVPAHRFRHPDHCFEWDREKFERWARGVARRNGYVVAFEAIAGRHPDLGGASQMAVFEATDRSAGAEAARAAPLEGRPGTTKSVFENRKRKSEHRKDETLDE